MLSSINNSYSPSEVCLLYSIFFTLWLFIGRVLVPLTFNLFFKHSVEPKRACQYKNLMTSWFHSIWSASWAYVIYYRDFHEHIEIAADYMSINQFTEGVYAKAGQLVGINTISYFLYDTLDYYQNLG